MNNVSHGWILKCRICVLAYFRATSTLKYRSVQTLPGEASKEINTGLKVTSWELNKKEVELPAEETFEIVMCQDDAHSLATAKAVYNALDIAERPSRALPVELFR